MPIDRVCKICEVKVHGLDVIRTHLREKHGVPWGFEDPLIRTDFRPQGTPQRRTWHCARCNSEVDRHDDGSMLCDTCKAVGPLPAAQLLPRGEARPGNVR